MAAVKNSAALSSDEKPDATPKRFARNITPDGAAYFEAGTGEALVLIHGVGMRLEAWAPQIEALATSHRVIAVDMPGHGESAKLPAASTIKDYVAWLGRLLDDLQIERTNLAGHSMGAMISGGAVATFPQRIRRVAYLNGVYRRDAAAKAAVIARAVENLRTGIDKEGPLARWFGDDANSRHARALTRGWLESVDFEGYTAAYTAFAHGDEIYADCWSRVTCPAMFLTGSGDPNSTPEMAEAMAAQAQNGWVEIVEGHRHMVNLTAPEFVTGRLLDWLATDEKPIAVS